SPGRSSKLCRSRPRIGQVRSIGKNDDSLDSRLRDQTPFSCLQAISLLQYLAAGFIIRTPEINEDSFLNQGGIMQSNFRSNQDPRASRVSQFSNEVEAKRRRKSPGGPQGRADRPVYRPSSGGTSGSSGGLTG